MNTISLKTVLVACGVFLNAFICVSCDNEKKATAFLFDKIPNGIKIESSSSIVSGNGDLLVGLKLNCSKKQLWDYLLALKINPKDLKEEPSLGWDHAVSNPLDHSGTATESKWSYFSIAERRRVLVSWEDGIGYVQYETF